MKPAVIVPVKSGGRKSRLSGVLDSSQREEFTKLLLLDVLQVLRSSGLIGGSCVVSPDAKMLELAGREGALTVKEQDDEGVNSAVSKGLSSLPSGSDVLVIPADLPLLKPSELTKLADGALCEVGIAPSRAFDGTNALKFTAPLRFPLSYDHHSFWNHLSGAAAAGLSVRVFTGEGLMFDVDSPEDLRALAGSRSKRPPAAFARRAIG